MGTNYYGRLKKPIKRIVKDYKEFHIGKSSLGWKFCFQTSEYFKDFKEFKEWLDDDNYEIYNEYDEKVDKKEFLQMILNKQKDTESQTHYDEYTKNIDGFDFSDNDFS
jgi:hypothetical protein